MWVGVAEEIAFRDPSTGPANDIQQATKTARAMVTDYGMSDRIGMAAWRCRYSRPSPVRA